MVTLTAENVHDLIEAFFATYYVDDILRTGDVQVSSQTIETGRKGFLAALRRMPESMGVNARGTVKQIIDEFAGPKQAAPGPRMAEGFTGIKPKAFTLPETITILDTDAVKISVKMDALEFNSMAIMRDISEHERALLVTALARALREASGVSRDAIAPQDDGLVTKEAVSVGPPGGFYDSTKYNGYAYLVPKNAINPKFTYQIRKGESK